MNRRLWKLEVAVASSLITSSRDDDGGGGGGGAMISLLHAVITFSLS